MKIEKYQKSLMKYYKAHMWCAFASAIVLAVFLMVVVLQRYLKEEYINYLIENNQITESSILEIATQNINQNIENCIQVGSEISVDETFYPLLEAYTSKQDSIAFFRQQLHLMLGGVTRTSQSITAVAVATKDGILYQYDNNSKEAFDSQDLWNEENEEFVKAAFQSIAEFSRNKNVPKYLNITEPRVHPGRTDRGLFHIAFPLKGKNQYEKMEYMLIISYNANVIESSLNQLNRHRNKLVQAFISDENEKIRYHQDRSCEQIATESYINEGNLTNLKKNLNYFDWQLNLAIDENELHKQVNNIYNRAFWLLALLVVAILLVFFITTQYILKPVGIIAQALKRAKSGNMREKIEVKGTHEIWKLANEYNEMTESIHEMNKQVEAEHAKVVESLKVKQRAERDALESQINAHFICNTLNAINYEAMENGNHKVSVLLKKLSNILRYTFDQKNQNVYMFQEILWVEQYLYLQKVRLENTFDYQIDFEPELEGWPCRKLMLQPFIENSIIHGFEGRQEGGYIRIVGRKDGNKLKLVLEDNGKGMDSERAKLIREIIERPTLLPKKGVGIGISNVAARMYMYYGEHLIINLETKLDSGTTFIFLIPTP